MLALFYIHICFNFGCIEITKSKQKSKRLYLHACMQSDVDFRDKFLLCLFSYVLFNGVDKQFRFSH